MKRLQGFVAGLLVALLFAPLVAMATNELTRTITVVENRMVFSVNGKRIDVPNFVVGGVTYVPIRAAADALGKKVGWDGGTGVSIDDPNPVESVAPIPTASPTPTPTQPPVVVPDRSVAPTPIPLPIVTETAAQRATELLAWLKNERGVWWFETKHILPRVVSDRATMEAWKQYFAEKQGDRRYDNMMVQNLQNYMNDCAGYKKYADDMTGF